MRQHGSAYEYFHTIKKPVSNMTRIEIEEVITEEAYKKFQKQAGDTPMIIKKVRWCIPHDGLVVEVDIYPFWSTTATAEIELGSEDGHLSFPDCIHIIREVTREKRYSNRSLAEALRDGKMKEPEHNKEERL
jgi:CYTH domain-containing protein